MDCLTDDLIASYNGGPAFTLPEPPPALYAAAPPPPPGAKGLYGGRMDNHVDSANFTVAWADGDATTSAANDASEALEAAWTALVEEQGWAPPVSSDDYFVWVILDPSLSGTGLTYELATDDYPDGYPVILLNPTYATNGRFWKSLAAHELNHALQYARREYLTGREEPWYWEASAEWGAELALPDVNMYATSSVYYADATDARYSSMEGYHQYGMFPLNAFVEENMTGAGGMLAVWERSEALADERWDVVLADALGVDALTLFARFSGAYAAESLRESALYEAPSAVATFDGEVQRGEVNYLGSDVFVASRDMWVELSLGDAILANGDEVGARIWANAGDHFTVTGALDDEPYNLIEGAEDGDTGLVDDDDGGGGDKAGGGTCGLGAPRHGAGWLGLVGLLALGRARRHPTRRLG
ncbi:MAG: hypothetical protein RIT28_2265 [Pseudomonadota bacterium]